MDELDELTILDYLKVGLTAPDHHFYKKPIFKSPEIKFSKEELKSSIGYAAKEIYLSVEDSINDLVNQGVLCSFALSGGADSRLILSILIKNHREKLKELYIYTRVHPSLGTENDRDYLIAKKLSKKFMFKHNAEVSQNFSSTYLVPLSEPKGLALSGLWGGELLGGTLISCFPCNLQDLKELDDCSPLKQYCVKNWNLCEADKLALFFSLLYRTAGSAFYNSPTWFTPYLALNYTASPFLHPKFLNKLFQLGKNYVDNYNLYQAILETFCLDFIEIEINNSNFKIGARNSFRIGKEAKQEIDVLNPRSSPLDPEVLPILEFLENHKKFRYYPSLVKNLHYCSYSKIPKGYSA